MNSGRTVFAQLIDHLTHKEFHKCVARHGGDRYAKNFSCWDRYLVIGDMRGDCSGNYRVVVLILVPRS